MIGFGVTFRRRMSERFVSSGQHEELKRRFKELMDEKIEAEAYANRAHTLLNEAMKARMFVEEHGLNEWLNRMHRKIWNLTKSAPGKCVYHPWRIAGAPKSGCVREYRCDACLIEDPYE